MVAASVANMAGAMRVEKRLGCGIIGLGGSGFTARTLENEGHAASLNFKNHVCAAGGQAVLASAARKP
jgi:hypothetical protein